MLSVEDGKKQNFDHRGRSHESDPLRTTSLALSLMCTVVLFTKPLELSHEELPDIYTPISVFQGHNCVFFHRN